MHRRHFVVMPLLAWAAGSRAAPVAVPAAPAARPAPAAATASASAGAARLAIPDVALLDQHGRTRRLQAQVLGGGVNLVNFIFTTCSSLCPMASAVLAELSRQPEFAATQALRLVSITVDPLNDTPQRLHEFSKRFATPASEWRWDWLTGTPANVDAVLSALRQRGRGVEGHSTDFLLLDGRNGQGRWLAGDTPVRQLLAAAQRMVNAS